MILTAEKLGKRFPGEHAVDAVSDVDLSLDAGKFIAIVGRSGSGKSTLLGMLGGISRPSSGTVQVGGVDQWALRSNEHADFRNSRIGFVFQFASLLPTLRAIDNVALPALINGAVSEKEAYLRARLLLQRVGLEKRADFFPGQLSGGEQRRVAIARALINSPEILLADEPTADLDEQTEEEILNLLIDIHRSYKLTLVVVTHNPAIAARADRVVQMQAGKATESASQSGSADTEHDQPASPEQVERIKRIFESSPDDINAEKIRLGEGIERLIGRFVLWVVPLMAFVWAVHYGIENYQVAALKEKAAARAALETIAMSDLRADVKDVTRGPGKSYTVTLYLTNVEDKAPIYVMGPTVRGFVQVGTSWQEVPMKPLDGGAQKVVKITGEKLFRYQIEPDVKDYEQLLPYYMHVRFTNEMLVSPSSQPKTDLVERNDSYYVYLKPEGVTDAAIESKMKFPGAPPVWIPMPPH